MSVVQSIFHSFACLLLGISILCLQMITQQGDFKKRCSMARSRAESLYFKNLIATQGQDFMFGVKMPNFQQKMMKNSDFDSFSYKSPRKVAGRTIFSRQSESAPQTAQNYLEMIQFHHAQRTVPRQINSETVCVAKRLLNT